MAGFTPGLTNVTLTATSAVGDGLYAGFNSYTLSLGMSFAADASATSFTLDSWTFSVLNSAGDEVFSKAGSNTQPAFDPTTPAVTAQIALTDGGFLTGSLTPAPTLLQFSYQFNPDSPGLLNAALNHSAEAMTGFLTVGTDSGDSVGSLQGAYTYVPGPSALALLALGAVLTRRRAA